MSWPQYYFNKSDHFLCGLLLCVHFSISSNQLGGRVACALKTRKKTKKKNKKKELTCLSFNVQCGIGGKKSYPWYRNTPWGKFVIYTAHHSFNVRQSTRQSTAIRDCPWVTATETSPPTPSWLSCHTAAYMHAHSTDTYFMSYGKHTALANANLALNNTFAADRLMNWELARVKRRKQITNTQSGNRINERLWILKHSVVDAPLKARPFRSRA